jgi:hypothetical protein
MLEKKYFEEVEKSVKELMDRFSNSSPISEDDKKNYDELKKIQRQFMMALVQNDYHIENDTEFLSEFRREFANTYDDGVPEAIIVSLKKGRRTELRKEWWRGYKGLGKWEWDDSLDPNPTHWYSE